MAESPDTCPNCGAWLPENAQACDSCGSCEETGWNEAAAYQHAGIHYDSEDDDNGFDYDEFYEREFGHRKASGIQGKSLLFSIVAAIITILLIILLVKF